MTTLYATGFYFTSINDDETKAIMHVDCYANLVEKFKIQLSDSDDAEPFEARGINISFQPA